MTFAIHDNTIYGYRILADHDHEQSYTIRLYTKFHQKKAPSFTDILFTHAIAHYFDDYLAHNILFDIEEISLESCYDDHRELFEKRANYGWPFPHNGGRDLLAQANAHHAKAYQINTSYGLNGWVWARTLDIIKRDNAPQFDDP